MYNENGKLVANLVAIRHFKHWQVTPRRGRLHRLPVIREDHLKFQPAVSKSQRWCRTFAEDAKVVEFMQTARQATPEVQQTRGGRDTRSNIQI